MDVQEAAAPEWSHYTFSMLPWADEDIVQRSHQSSLGLGARRIGQRDCNPKKPGCLDFSESAKAAILDVSLLASTDFFIGTFSSNLSRLAYGLIEKAVSTRPTVDCPVFLRARHENTSQEGISAANTRGIVGSAQAVYAIPCALLQHLFCESKLGECMKEENALAVVDLISTLTAQMDEHALELQDTEAC
ncbi:hypothetical protein CYMTET_45131 [Cymbomonas tetramitiformis]|uniref:GT23 domain-containing protein n=1 Tax=Cymbomonas tetramitiformis TaxID=36881 RepID=A0AAE0EZZ8_9CHLO|nr:hypothetical protein CYMTET_45131 [Cymbomonas tetramitiformis]